ncbi:DICT sensory domain-containing protein [Haloarculaceae archaeon H-GB1-1]|nr:DICT sensory domain-containing protein [Haloarculaceae archaeon H-GB1-1]
MTLADLLASASHRQKSVTVFGPDAYPALSETLSGFDVTVSHEYLPVPPARGYLTLREGDRFLGSINAPSFAELATPTDRVPWDDRRRDSAYRKLVDTLANTTFRAADRSQLLATSREFEDRAYRVGGGTLHVGFQSARAFRRQTAVYEHLATETDLSIHVYVDASWDVPSLDGVAVHAEDADEIGRFWIVAFDGAGDDDAKCGLLATETAPGAFDGIWAYDPDLIDDVDAYLRKTYVG